MKLIESKYAAKRSAQKTKLTEADANPSDEHGQKQSEKKQVKAAEKAKNELLQKTLAQEQATIFQQARVNANGGILDMNMIPNYHMQESNHLNNNFNNNNNVHQSHPQWYNGNQQPQQFYVTPGGGLTQQH